MEVNQSELFEEIPAAVNSPQQCAQFRAREKIVQVPFTVWKDGRVRFDLTSHNAGFVTRRNVGNARAEVKRRLCQALHSRVEDFAEDALQNALGAELVGRRARVRKKDLAKPAGPIYANPFQDNSRNFGKCPDWLLQRHDLKPIEKLIYGRLLFPAKPICESWNQELGVITELHQSKLAEAIGMSRSATNEWLVSLQVKGWLKCDGNPGAKQTTRFLWKDGMPETCRYARQVSGEEPAGGSDRSCRTSQQEPVATSGKSCLTPRQVSEGIEKRESLREERNKSRSLGWGRGGAA